MSAKIKTLLDKLGGKIYPKTKTSAVYDENNTSLDTILSNIYNKDESNETFLLRSEQKKLGARNVWTDDYIKYASRKNSATITKDTDINGFYIQCTSSTPSGYDISLTRITSLFGKYGKITLSFEFMGNMACSCNVGMVNKSPITTLPTDWTTYSATFNAKAQATNLCFYNTDSTKTPIIYVKNFMIRLASDTDDTYTEYTKTNLQLTKNMENKLDNVNVAAIEEGPTSSANYSVGQFIIYRGYLYKVISAIFSGDLLSEGTNIDYDKIGTEISTINSQLINKLDKSGAYFTFYNSAIVDANNAMKFYSDSDLVFASGGSNKGIYNCTNTQVYVMTPTFGSYRPITASAFTVGSSRLIKENVKALSDDEAKKILDVEAVAFDYKESFGGQRDQYGVIAEDVEKIIPFVVSTPEDYDESAFDESKGVAQPLKSVDYAKFVPYLIRMIQIQQAEIDELKKRL